MMKIAALIFLLAFAAQTFSRAIVFVDFYMNQSYIAARKCENRSRPMLHCNGKCQLAKKLKQQEKKDEQNPGRKAENKNEVISSRSFFAGCPASPLPASSAYKPVPGKPPVDQSFSIFHPPCA
jgi:hypothetical protein